ncbi:MAG: sulfatase, partial [Actinomycetes bacterium]
GDLGLEPERDLVEQWRPGGKLRHTEMPQVSMTSEGLEARCATSGASIGWTLDSPVEGMQARSPLEQVSGSPLTDGRRWNLYSGPVAAEKGTKLWIRAWRLGFEPSDEVAITIN